MMTIEIEAKSGLVLSVDGKRTYLIDGGRMKNKKYREIITFRDGSKIKVVYS